MIMGYIIEVDNNGTITLTLPDDTTKQSNSLDEIFDLIRTDLTKTHKVPSENSLAKLFNL
jgi:hypothetical protein